MSTAIHIKTNYFRFGSWPEYHLLPHGTRIRKDLNRCGTVLQIDGDVLMVSRQIATEHYSAVRLSYRCPKGNAIVFNGDSLSSETDDDFTMRLKGFIVWLTVVMIPGDMVS